jgi:DNA (cytosine-5)-methyltransferase 1
MISFLSICSGIEAASAAWEPLGFRAVGFSEIEAFPSAVLAHRYGSNMPGEPLVGIDPQTGQARPAGANGVPNHCDFTKIDLSAIPAPLDVLVGGTPCQAFSIAGKRLSLDDARGNLTLSFVVLAHGLARSHGLRNIVWENVPGVLNTPDNAFGCFLGALVGGDAALDPPGGAGWPGAGMASGPGIDKRGARLAWRVLDAQYFGVPQRRRRVFLVADLGGGADPATVLFERKGLLRHPPARGKAGQGAAGDAAAGAGKRGAFGGGNPDGSLAGTLSAKWAKGSGGPAGDEVQNMVAHPLLAKSNDSHAADLDTYIVHALTGEGHDASEDGSGRGVPIVPVAFSAKDHGADAGDDISPTLRSGGHAASHANAGVMPAVAYAVHENQRAEISLSDTAGALKIGGGKPGQGYPTVAYAIQERAVSDNPDAGPQGKGFNEGVGYTLEARHHVQAVAYAFPAGLSGTQVAASADISPALGVTHTMAAAYDLRGREGGAQFEGPHDTANIRAASGGSSRSYVADTYVVRRLTPTECERLQGFPDNWTQIPWRGKAPEDCPDGPRYRALGNSMAAPVMAWIGERLRDAMPERSAP